MDYTYFMETVKGRFSCRKYQDRPIEQEKLDKILEAGRAAPTAKNLQPQRILVITSDEAKAKVDSLTPCRFGAPVMMLLAYDANSIYHYPGDKYQSGSEDIAIVATHMMLAAEILGIKTCWVNYFDPDKAITTFELPEGIIPVMMMAFGYEGDDAAPSANHASRKPIEETVKYI